MFSLRRFTLTLTAVALVALAPASHAMLIAYWNIPDADDNTLTDLSGNGHTLVGSGSPVNQSGITVAPNPVPNPDPATSGATGSIYMNGFGEVPHIDAASPFQMTNVSSFTLEGWILASPGASGFIASDRHGGNSYRGWFVNLNGTKIEFYSNSGGTASNIISATDVADDLSHHFAAVWDHTSSEMSLFVDGILQGAPESHAVGSYSVFGFSIGGRDGTSPGSSFVDNRLTVGTRLDELRFSDEALAPSEFLNSVSSIPEPGTAVLLLSMVLALAALRRRKNYRC